jgi:hypothetical protein
MMANALVQAFEPIQVAAGEMIILQGEFVQAILPTHSSTAQAGARHVIFLIWDYIMY